MDTTRYLRNALTVTLRTTFFVILFCLFCSLVPMALASAHAGPTLAALTIQPQSIDVSSSPGIVMISVEAVSAAGVKEVDAWVESPTGQYTLLSFSFNSGTVNDGWWAAQVFLPPGSANGQWTIYEVVIYDI